MSRSVIARRRTIALAALLAGAALAAWLLLGGDDRRGADLETIEVRSEAVGQALPVSVVTPDGAEGEERPLLVFLHGRDGNEESGLTEEMYAALDEQGDAAPVVAFPDGGGASFWHDRADGEWGRYVAEEVVAEVSERFSVDEDRVAIGGISMGGFGALNLARLYPDRFCAVGGHSAALWRTAGETAAGAFDDAADFARNDVIASAFADASIYAGRPVWIDAGEDDPFLPAIENFEQALETAGVDLSAHTYPGGHDSEYWAQHWDEYLRFYAGALSRC